MKAYTESEWHKPSVIDFIMTIGCFTTFEKNLSGFFFCILQLALSIKLTFFLLKKIWKPTCIIFINLRAHEMKRMKVLSTTQVLFHFFQPTCIELWRFFAISCNFVIINSADCPARRVLSRSPVPLRCSGTKCFLNSICVLFVFNSFAFSPVLSAG